MTDIKRPDWVSDRLVEERGQYAGFQMYTREGNDAVAEALLAVFREAQSRSLHRDTIVVMVQVVVAQVRKAHPEIHDTEPEWAITDAVNDFLTEGGFATIHRESLF